MGNETFYRKYVLLKDTPRTHAGTVLKWDLWRELYTTELMVTGVSETEETFTRKEVEWKKDWFKPLGEPEPFYDPFPENLKEHFYFGELRHNKMCRFCTVAQCIIESEEFEKQVTEVLRKLYNDKIGSNFNETKKDSE